MASIDRANNVTRTVIREIGRWLFNPVNQEVVSYLEILLPVYLEILHESEYRE